MLDVWAQHANTKLLLVGDDKQLPEIEAGGAFRALTERHGAVELTEVRRQDRDWDRDALAALRAGRTADWAGAYIEHSRIKTADTAPAVREQLTDGWWAARQTGADARMIAIRRSDVADLNARARAKMRAAGRLGADVAYDDKAFARGDEIVVTQNDRRLGVLNGDRGRVLDAADTHLEVRFDQDHQVQLPATFVTDRHVDHGYATTAHKAQGATVDQAFVLGSQEAYREWGHTALSRHRDRSTYYLAAPKTFINRDPAKLDDAEQLTLTLEQSLAESRRDELAIELAERFGTQRPGPSDPDLDMDIGM